MARNRNFLDLTKCSLQKQQHLELHSHSPFERKPQRSQTKKTLNCIHILHSHTNKITKKHFFKHIIDKEGVDLTQQLAIEGTIPRATKKQHLDSSITEWWKHFFEQQKSTLELFNQWRTLSMENWNWKCNKALYYERALITITSSISKDGETRRNERKKDLENTNDILIVLKCMYKSYILGFWSN